MGEPPPGPEEPGREARTLDMPAQSQVRGAHECSCSCPSPGRTVHGPGHGVGSRPSLETHPPVCKNQRSGGNKDWGIVGAGHPKFRWCPGFPSALPGSVAPSLFPGSWDGREAELLAACGPRGICDYSPSPVPPLPSAPLSQASCPYPQAGVLLCGPGAPHRILGGTPTGAPLSTWSISYLERLSATATCSPAHTPLPVPR